MWEIMLLIVGALIYGTVGFILYKLARWLIIAFRE